MMNPSPTLPKRTRRFLRNAAFATCIIAASAQTSNAAESPGASSILQDLRSFRTLGTALYVAAHPDDENTQLITYLARGRGYRMAYLSVTRGDGGQNVLGPEFGEELGVIRTQELLAARRIDGGRQFFTRAIDFGFSKTPDETLKIWNRQEVLGDVVRVIREFRPDVVFAGFSPVPQRGQHGHHTSSAILALEAFKLAGDPKAFPEQLEGKNALTPWRPKRIFMNNRFNRGGGGGAEGNSVTIETGGNDPVTGESFASLAGRSRSMHKTQGFGNFAGPGGGTGPRPESFRLLDGDPATNDIMDGIDTTWNRVKGAGEIAKLADDAVNNFNAQNPAASVPTLLAIHKQLAALPSDPLLNDKRAQLDRILQACLGLSVKTVVPQAEAVPGETLHLRETVTIESDVPVRWAATRYSATSQHTTTGLDLHPHQEAARDATETLPPNTPLSQPYWLREEGSVGTYRVDDPALIGRLDNPPAFPVEYVFEVGGQTLVIPDEPVQLTGESGIHRQRHLDVIPPVTLKFGSEVKLFAPKETKPVELDVTAFRDATTGSLELQAPAGWTITPASQPFHLATAGANARFTFRVTAPAQHFQTRLGARAHVGNAWYDTERIEIRYDHIPVQLLQPLARIQAVSLDMATRGRKVGYIAGAGDSIAEDLEQMGYAVTQLTGADLTAERLRDFDAIVVGIRAFNVRTDLGPGMPALFAYADQGGTVIEQYNRPNDLKVSQLAPVSLRLSNNRVTDETAPMTFLAPDHPALNTPNKITSADFAGWIQERGIYFPSEWGDEFVPILACNDPGEEPLKGGLLVAKHGKGYFVYTSLVWFRQLPAGVPGAYRLFANLVSLGK